MGRRRNEPVDVFQYIDMPPDGDPKPCWPWLGGTGGRDNDKRGYFTVGGVKWLAYRLVYWLVHGELLADEKVRHTCDNGMCCNPYHLEKGTQSDNENDKYERDRWGFPARIIEEILNLSDNPSLGQEAIAAIVTEKFGIVVSQQRVSDILTGARRKRQSDRLQQKGK